MDSIWVSEAPDPGSIPGEATWYKYNLLVNNNIFDTKSTAKTLLKLSHIYAIVLINN